MGLNKFVTIFQQQNNSSSQKIDITDAEKYHQIHSGVRGPITATVLVDYNNNPITVYNSNSNNDEYKIYNRNSSQRYTKSTIWNAMKKSTINCRQMKDHNRILVPSSSNQHSPNKGTSVTTTTTATTKPQLRSSLPSTPSSTTSTQLQTSILPTGQQQPHHHHHQHHHHQQQQRSNNNGSATILHNNINNKSDGLLINQKSHINHNVIRRNSVNNKINNNGKLLNGNVISGGGVCGGGGGGGVVSNVDVDGNTNTDVVVTVKNVPLEINTNNLLHSNKCAEAFGVLIKHLVFNLDAFSCPSLKIVQENTKKTLLETRLLLDDTRTACQNLEEQLADRETYFATREKDLQELHNCELSRAENCLNELERTAKERINKLEIELIHKQTQHENEFKSFRKQSEDKIIEQETHLNFIKNKEIELLKQISALSSKENELRDKVVINENEFSERLLAAGRRERDLTEKINLLNKQLDDLNKKAENKERELEEKLNLSIDEIGVLRHSRNLLNETLTSSSQSTVVTATTTAATTTTTTTTITQPTTNMPVAISSTANGPIPRNPQMLQDEIESLRCVLELKQSEISDLRKHNQELQKSSNELPIALVKVSTLESRLEDVNIQLQAKCDEEKELLQRNKLLQDSYSYEMKNRKRLSLHNEELQWKLKQNSEKFSTVLTELSKSHPDHSSFLNDTKVNLYCGQQEHNTNSNSNNHHQQQHNNSDSYLNNSIMNRSNGSEKSGGGCGGDFFSMDDISPPTSPMIKGVVEKSDSVSWVLEMNDDESPEVLASRMVRRAGSFRSSFNERINNSSNGNIQHLSHGNAGTPKRQLSHSSGGHVLAQSASATSLLRHHSDSSSQPHQQQDIIPSTINNTVITNMSSSAKTKLGCIKQNSEPKNIERTNKMITNGAGILSRKLDIPSTWTEPLSSSSPNLKRLRNGSINNGTIVTQKLSTTINNIEKNNNRKKVVNNANNDDDDDGDDDDDDDDNDDEDDDDDEHIDITTPSTSNFKRNTNNPFKQNKRGLITCNTASLTTTQRSELCSKVPIQQQQQQQQPQPPSTLKELKKFQQIKESAGEAMVSGTNSEDEASIGSISSGSSESDSLLSGTSSHTGSYVDEQQQRRHRRHSSNDALIHKIVASLSGGDGDGGGDNIGTPMEVSWSEDGDQYPNESIV